MARTKRKDPIDHRAAKVTGITVPWCGTLDLTDSPKEIRRAHSDSKKTWKPGRKAKAYLHKGQKAKAKMAVKTAKDYDNLIVPQEPRSDVWKWA